MSSRTNLTDEWWFRVKDSCLFVCTILEGLCCPRLRLLIFGNESGFLETVIEFKCLVLCVCICSSQSMVGSKVRHAQHSGIDVILRRIVNMKNICIGGTSNTSSDG